MIEELKSNTGSLFFWGCYLYELGLSQEERDKLGLPPLTDAEKEFVANLKEGMEERKEAKEKSKELQKTDNDDKFVTLRVPLKMAAPGWGLKLEKTVFPHVNIPKPDIMETSAVKPLGEILGRKLDEEMTAFGNEHGFPVIFVFYQEKTETNGGIVKCTGTTQLFTKDQMHEAAEFASQHGGELGVYDPRSAEETYKDKYMQQVVMDNELPLFCKNHHCTERGPKCDKCAYTAMGPWR